MNAVVPVEDAADRSRVCETILRALPHWFGIESAVVDYITAVRALPTFAVRDDAGTAVGFLALKPHTPFAAEVYVMGVLPAHHGRGVVTALVEAAERHARAAGAEYLQVKTLGPSHPSERYARTRTFYERRGFRPLEELHGLWSEGNPTLIMVKRLAG